VRGAEAAWRRYLNDNPIFDKNNPKEMTLNPNRRGWQEYFGGANAEQSSVQSVPEGYTQIGTSGGKPVYRDAQGNTYMAQ
jgi:hypothetical protein